MGQLGINLNTTLHHIAAASVFSGIPYIIIKFIDLIYLNWGRGSFVNKWWINNSNVHVKNVSFSDEYEYTVYLIGFQN